MRIRLVTASMQRHLRQADVQRLETLERVSSGRRINKAADDAAGLAISQKMQAQVRGLNQAVRNARNAISLVQTAEGGLGEVQAVLQRMRELAVQAATDTLTGDERRKVQAEVDHLAAEVTRISSTTEFNTMRLLSGSFAGRSFLIGAGAAATLGVTIRAADAESLGFVPTGRVQVLQDGGLVARAALDRSTLPTGTYTVQAEVSDRVNFHGPGPPAEGDALTPTSAVVQSGAVTLANYAGAATAAVIEANPVPGDFRTVVAEQAVVNGNSVTEPISGTDAQLRLVVDYTEGGSTTSVTIGGGTASTKKSGDTGANVGAALQTEINGSALNGKVTVAWDASNSRFVFTSVVADAVTLKVSASTGAAVSRLGFPTTGLSDTGVAAYAPNLDLVIAVDGQPAETITVAEGNYTGDGNALAAAVQAAINANVNLAGRVTVTWTANRLRFTTTSTGAASSLTISGLTATANELGFSTTAVSAVGSAASTEDLTLLISLHGGAEIATAVPGDDYSVPGGGDNLAAAIQNTVNQTSLVGLVSVVWNSTLERLIFTTVDTGSEATLSLRGNAAAKLGFGDTATTGEGADIVLSAPASLSVAVGDVTVSVSMGAGDHAATDVVNTINSQLGASPLSARVAAEWDGTGRRLLIRGAETVDAFTVTGEAGSPLGFGAAAVTGYGRIVLGLAYTELLLTVADENGGTVAQGFLAGPEGQVAFPNGLRLQLALNAAMIDSLPIGAAVGQTALLTVVNAPSGVGGPNLTTQRTASEALAILDRALASVTEQRSALGAVQNRLEHTAANLAVASQNMTAARSRIEDADMAAEVARLARAAVVQDAAFRMTAQGRVRAQMVLRLLRPGDPPR